MENGERGGRRENEREEVVVTLRWPAGGHCRGGRIIFVSKGKGV